MIASLFIARARNRLWRTEGVRLGASLALIVFAGRMIFTRFEQPSLPLGHIVVVLCAAALTTAAWRFVRPAPTAPPNSDYLAIVGLDPIERLIVRQVDSALNTLRAVAAALLVFVITPTPTLAATIALLVVCFETVSRGTYVSLVGVATCNRAFRPFVMLLVAGAALLLWAVVLADMWDLLMRAALRLGWRTFDGSMKYLGLAAIAPVAVGVGYLASQATRRARLWGIRSSTLGALHVVTRSRDRAFTLAWVTLPAGGACALVATKSQVWPPATDVFCAVTTCATVVASTLAGGPWRRYLRTPLMLYAQPDMLAASFALLASDTAMWLMPPTIGVAVVALASPSSAIWLAWMAACLVFTRSVAFVVDAFTADQTFSGPLLRLLASGSVFALALSMSAAPQWLALGILSIVAVAIATVSVMVVARRLYAGRFPAAFGDLNQF